MTVAPGVIESGPFAGLQRRAYGCITADPPWHFNAYAPPNETGNRRDVEVHYSTMSQEQIMALPVGEIAAKDCHLFIWTTGPKLPATFDVIKAWGFKYSGVAFTWVKLKRRHDAKQLRMIPSAESDLHVGLGFTTRKNAEFCLLARRGSARRVAKDVREIIMAPVREHSRKPEEFRDRVERYVGPDIQICELFARSSRPGWTAWGNEVSKYEAAA